MFYCTDKLNYLLCKNTLTKWHKCYFFIHHKDTDNFYVKIATLGKSPNDINDKEIKINYFITDNWLYCIIQIDSRYKKITVLSHNNCTIVREALAWIMRWVTSYFILLISMVCCNEIKNNYEFACAQYTFSFKQCQEIIRKYYALILTFLENCTPVEEIYK